MSNRVEGSARAGTRRSVALCALSITPAIAAVSGDRHWILDVLSNFVAHGVIVLCLVALIAAFTKRSTLALAALTCALAHAPFFATFYLPPRAMAASTGPRLRLLIANLQYNNDRHDRVRELIARVQPDVLILPELTRAWRNDLDAVLAPYAGRAEHVREDTFGLGLYTKTALQVVPIVPTGTEVAAVRIVRDGIPFTIVAVHPPPPIGAELTRARNLQLRALARVCPSLGENLIVAGDFNATSYAPIFREVLALSGLRDSRAGFGLQGTWPASLPELLRVPIDHVLVSKSLRVTQRVVGSNTHSDHRPVYVEITR